MKSKKPLKKVLLIDDDEFILQIIQASFNMIPDKIKLFTFSTAQSAFDFMKTQQPDVVILDLGLPDMNGLEVIRRLREIGNGSIQVIVLTGNNGIQQQKKALSAGAKLYFTKPFIPSLLRETVLDLLNNP